MIPSLRGSEQDQSLNKTLQNESIFFVSISDMFTPCSYIPLQTDNQDGKTDYEAKAVRGRVY
jgi:uncharacterized protein YunC (DUF1805 family)